MNSNDNTKENQKENPKEITNNSISNLSNLSNPFSKETQRKCKVFLNDLLTNSGIVIDKHEKFVFSKNIDYIITKDLELKKEVNFLLQRKFLIKNEIVVNEMINKLNSSEWKDHDLVQNFKPEIGIQVKQRYEPINEIEKLNGEKGAKTYTIDEGHISLIFVWSIYSQICKKQLKHINEIYSKNPNWEAEVKFISINIDSASRQSANKLVNSLNLHNMDHYFVDIAKFPNHQLNYMIKICNPVTLIINSEGCIDFAGSVFEIDLKEKIKNVLNRSNLKNDLSLFQITNCIEKKNLKTFIKNLETRINIIRDKELFVAPHLFNLLLRIKKVYNVGNLNCQNYQAELTYHLNVNDEMEVEKNLFRGLEVLKNLQIACNYVNTMVIELAGTTCKICDDNLYDNPHYYCLFCDLYYCKNCGNQISNVFKPEHLHNHFLIYLRPSNLYFANYVLDYVEEIDNTPDFKYFNDNTVSKDFIQLYSNHFHTKCDGCMSFPIKTVRWKCLNCMFKNLCNDCLMMCENKFLFSEEIYQRLKSVGCDPICHVFQKIVFDGFMM